MSDFRHSGNPANIEVGPDGPLTIQEVAAYSDLLGNSGATSLEVGFLSERAPHHYWAKVNYSGRIVIAEHHAHPTFALEEITKKVLHGGTCSLCDRQITIGYIRDGYCSRILCDPGPDQTLRFLAKCKLTI